ncbi:ubiquitin thioesterase otulin isoform X4 [Rhineura floridana]|uniref:ubiquitin thioesterase otulin isoform X4 n=1 Tax=Rhineura floridana TaxID=261503 RepID=UPI002AC83C3B|nr:ubiquitin thioesterase otulin isoform X4 [Rhineura floridana]
MADPVHISSEYWLETAKGFLYPVEMSTDKDELLCKPQDNGKATIAGDENKLSEQRSGPEKQVSTSPGITTLTDNTKQFKLSSSQAQATQESEEDMYRDAEEIEREKILLVCGTGSSDFPENRLSVEPEVGIMDYCQEEWRGNTSHAKCIRKGYEAVSQKFISIRRVRGDNYCAIRATLFQALSQATRLPGWLQREDMILLPEKLMDKYGWITQWQLRQKWTSKVENLVDEIKKCLMLLKSKWKHMSEMKMLTEKQAACDELFRSEEDEYKLYEAVKFLMLNTAIELYEDNEKGKEVPMFSWLLFARDTSSNPSQLMKNHLNQLGLTGGLEQVEMFLLAYALQHTIQVYRMYKYNTDEFVTLYPNDPEEAWPVVTLITEDDRHYNVLARMCQETSL